MSEAAMDDWDFEPHILYRIYDGFDRPLYFGETNNLPRRLGEHQEKAWFRRSEITIKVNMFPNRAEALAAESHAITAEKPWYNKAKLKPVEARPRAAAVTKPRRARRPAARPRVVKAPAETSSRDLLADVSAVLGAERIRLSAIVALLRKVAPEYQALNGQQLWSQLKLHGVRVTNGRNVPQLDPADLLQVVADKAR